MNVGENRQPKRLANLRKDGKRRLQPNSASALGAGAVRLVEGCLIDEADAEARGDLFQRGRHFEGVRPAFQLAWTGEKRERQGIADANAPAPPRWSLDLRPS